METPCDRLSSDWAVDIITRDNRSTRILPFQWDANAEIVGVWSTVGLVIMAFRCCGVAFRIIFFR